MMRAVLLGVAAAAMLFGAGCTGIDDRQEQVEYEKLRKHSTPRGDRVLPSFENKSSSEEEDPFAIRAGDPAPDERAGG